MTMKKHVLLLVAAVFAGLMAQAEIITPSQAVRIAEDFLGESLAPQRVRAMRRTAAASPQEDAPYYIISRGENKGYILVSGDDCQPAVLGYTDEGDFDENNLSPAYRDMLECYTSVVALGREAGSPTYKPRRAPAERNTIQPLMKSHWNQGAPWNILCPICPDNGEHAVVGCVATATSQVVYYFRKDLPHQLLSTTPTYKGSGDEQCDVTVSYPRGTPIEYDLMFDSYNNNEPQELKMPVATLCFTLGAAARLGYWHSTGGYISESNKAMKSHFGLGGTNLSRNEMNIDDWESIIYNSLVAQKPLIYSGFTTDGKSGHAINIDGYNARNGLWHFNFGWGGGGDGWYTLDLKDGVNGFCIWQEIVYNITPTHPNVSAVIRADSILYRRVNNTVYVDITNNGTIPYNNFNLFLQTSEKAPTTSSSPIATNTQTFVAPGETVAVPFELKPSLIRNYHLFVTDANRQVLDHAPVSVEEPSPELTLHAIGVSASTDTVMVGDVVYRKLNNNTADVYADISNSISATAGQPSVKFILEQWNPETGETKSYKNKTINTTSYAAGERNRMEHTFNRLSQGLYLTLRVEVEDMDIVTSDTLIRFVVGEKSLDVASTDNGVVTLAGDWDATAFRSLNGDPAITAYDLRGITGVTGNLTAANPNALFYVSQPVEGANIVCNGHCADLQLLPGYDFRPLEPFQADKAQYTPEFIPCVQQTLILPFTCQRPTEYICRHISEVGKSYFTEATTVDVLEAATPYMIQTSATASKPFVGRNVTISLDADTAVTLPFIGTFTAQRPYPFKPENARYILSLDTDPTATTQYFNSQDTNYVAAPFTFVLTSDSKKVRATVNETLEKAYRKLAQAINDAQTLYDIHHVVIRDSANIQMSTMLAEGRAVWKAMELEATEVNSLTKALNAFCETYPLMVGIVTEPVDFTAFITNPSFELNNKNGWKSDAHSVVRNTSNINTFIARGQGNYFLHNNSQGKSTRISQTITGLLTGWYRFTAMTGTDEGGVVNLFAGDETVQVPASELGKYYLTEAVIDSIWVDNGELTIGVAEGDTWYKCDNFRLLYLGDPNYQPTGIRTPSIEPSVSGETVEPKRQGLFDLMGRPVASPDDMMPGVIYIYNGRKVIRTE